MARVRRPEPGAPYGSDEWKARGVRGRAWAREQRRRRSQIAPAELEALRKSGTVSESIRALGLVDAAQAEAVDLLDALGGEEHVSPQRRVLIDDVARIGLVMRAELARYVQKGDADAAGRVGTLAGQRRSSLAALGLDVRRVERDLDEYLARRTPAERANGSDPHAQPEPMADRAAAGEGALERGRVEESTA